MAEAGGPAHRVTPWQPPDLRMAQGAGRPEPTDHLASHPAYAQGWEEGRADLLRAREAEAQHQRAAFDAVTSALEQVSATLQAQFTQNVSLMACAVAWHLIEREFTADSALLVRLVERALQLVPLTGPVVLRLHPEDLDLLRGSGAVMPNQPGLELTWVADAALHRSGVVVEGPGSVVDGRIDRALLDTYERLTHG